MDLQFTKKTLHIPQELIGQICRDLFAADDIRNARLINKCFNYATKPLMTDLWNSPSELFVEPHAPTNGHVACKDDKSRRYVTNPFTIWNWLNVPANLLLEDGDTPVGARFEELICAPDQVNLDKGHAKGKGRKATCWGRAVEQPNLFCIVFQFDCSDCWATYRRSEEGKALRDYLRSIASGSEVNSISEQTFFPPAVKRRLPLFEGFYEIRSVYFKSSMSLEQKAKLNSTQHLMRAPSLCHLPSHIGFSPWCWLRGLLQHKGETTVAARFVFNWKSPELEESYRRTSTRSVEVDGVDVERDVDKAFDNELEEAGILTSESLHVVFSYGPWRN